MSRRAFLIAGVAALLVLFAAANIFAAVGLRGVRVDLTEHQLYSLSPGARAVLTDIAEPIDVTLVYSRTRAQDFAAIRAYGARVIEMLRTFEAVADGGLRVRIVEPEPFSEEEDQALAAGLNPLAARGGDPLYLGLIAENAVDERRVVPFFSPQRENFLEYDLVRLISELEQPTRGVVAMISGAPLESGGPPGGFSRASAPLFIYDQLLRSYDLRVLDRDFTAIPAETEVLLIIHPWPLSPEQAYAVDQFALETGRMVVLTDPDLRLASASLGGFAPAPTETASNLPDLFAAWGVDFDVDSVVLDFEGALRVRADEDGRPVELPYPTWIGVPPDAMDAEDLATAPLQRGLRVATAGRLSQADGATTDFTPLVTTSSFSKLAPVEQVRGDPPPSVLLEFLVGDPPQETFTLAARVSGPITTAFPDGPPEAPVDVDAPADVVDPAPDADAENEPTPLHRTMGTAEIVVVSDADLLDDAFYVTDNPLLGPTTSRDNADFILNALDVLTGSADLVSLRSRAGSERPMTRIETLRTQADARFFAEEDALEGELAEAEARLVELREAGGGSGVLRRDDPETLAAEQAEFARVQAVILETRARLRAVQRNLRADIDRLEAIMTALNVWLAPLVMVALGIWVFIARRRAAEGGRP